MNNHTKMKINQSANEVFEAFVDPEKIGKFWFSSSSERWEQGKTITLRYDEYQAEGKIKIVQIEQNETIVFHWGENGEGNKVTITLEEVDRDCTIVEVVEEGFIAKDDLQVNHMLDNKEGWVYSLTCLKAYMEFGIDRLRAGLVKD